jgi:hypothetical protein
VSYGLSARTPDEAGPLAGRPVRFQLHPNMASICQWRLASLREALGREETRAEAAEIIRSLVNEIVLTPEDGELKVDLRGDLAGWHPGDRCKRKEAGPWPGAASRIGVGASRNLSWLRGPASNFIYRSPRKGANLLTFMPVPPECQNRNLAVQPWQEDRRGRSPPLPVSPAGTVSTVARWSAVQTKRSPGLTRLA